MYVLVLSPRINGETSVCGERAISVITKGRLCLTLTSCIFLTLHSLTFVKNKWRVRSRE